MDIDISYDLKLEELLDEIKSKMWINEELQIQPKEFRESIFKTFLENRSS